MRLYAVWFVRVTRKVTTLTPNKQASPIKDLEVTQIEHVPEHKP